MAGIIRREQLTATRSFSFADLERQGRLILEHARAQAAETLRAAEARARQVAEEQRQAGYPAGHAAGLAEGRAAGLRQIREEAHAAATREAREQIAALVRSLTGAVTDFEHSHRSLIAQAETGLIELALAIARRVCKLEVGASTAAARANARHLLELVQHTGDAELHLHPAECEPLRELAPELVAHVEGLGHVTFVADPNVEHGGCLLRTRDGTIDATIETQLQRVAEALRVNPECLTETPAAPRPMSPQTAADSPAASRSGRDHDPEH
jgi:flagellar assembly protein FliH